MEFFFFFLKEINAVGIYKKNCRKDKGIKRLFGGCPRKYVDILRICDKTKFFDTPDYARIYEIMNECIKDTNSVVFFYFILVEFQELLFWNVCCFWLVLIRLSMLYDDAMMLWWHMTKYIYSYKGFKMKVYGATSYLHTFSLICLMKFLLFVVWPSTLAYNSPQLFPIILIMRRFIGFARMKPTIKLQIIYGVPILRKVKNQQC